MLTRLLLLAAVAAPLLGSCAAAQSPGAATDTAPSTPRQMLFTVEESYAAAINTINDLIVQKAITPKIVGNVMAMDSFAAAALDNADAMVKLAEQSPTQANLDNQTKAIAIAQQAVQSMIVVLQQAQEPPEPGAGAGGK